MNPVISHSTTCVLRATRMRRSCRLRMSRMGMCDVMCVCVCVCDYVVACDMM